MRVVLDTGILLRLINQSDPNYAKVRAAVRELRRRGDFLVAAPQNFAEFWNVCTRPTSARGGYGLSVQATERRLRLLEWILSGVCPDTPTAYPEWRRMVMAHSIMGVQVHDARLVALMLVHRITHILTLNPDDFVRYPGIFVLTPESLVQAAAKPPV